MFAEIISKVISSQSTQIYLEMMSLVKHPKVKGIKIVGSLSTGVGGEF